MNKVVLDCDDLAFYYQNEKIFGPINLRLQQGEVLSVIGPNGGGKSTFLKVISKLHDQSGHYHGQLKIFSRERKELNQSSFPIGYLPQKEKLNLLIPIKTNEILESYKIQSTFHGSKSIQFTKFTKKELIEMLGLSDILEHDFRSLSGGQRQRVMLAKAFLTNSPLLILDEPAKGLDIQGQTILSKLIKETRNRNSIDLEVAQSLIIVDHDIPRAIKISDKVLCLNRDAHWHDSKNLLDQTIINKIYKCEIDHMINQSLQI